jgi:hypothetical protein
MKSKLYTANCQMIPSPILSSPVCWKLLRLLCSINQGSRSSPYRGQWSFDGKRLKSVKCLLIPPKSVHFHTVRNAWLDMESKLYAANCQIMLLKIVLMTPVARPQLRVDGIILMECRPFTILKWRADRAVTQPVAREEYDRHPKQPHVASYLVPRREFWCT